ncbi:MAG: FAD-dependent oxidoreductase, partial [Bacteroidota bacterium]
MKRRNFIRTTALSAAATSFLVGETKGFDKNINDQVYKEPSREVPIVDEYDVIIAGAGPAGVSAAIEAGRNGVKTLLIEVHGCLGGVWTSGLLSWILDEENKVGLMEEIKTRLGAMEAAATIDTGKTFSFDVEKMKYLLEEMCVEADVDILFHTRVVEAVKDNNKRLTHLITESKSGREAWAGKTFIDTSGDGDLAARAGCGFDFGNATGKWQPMSLLCLVTGINFEEIKPYVRYAGDTGQQSKKRLVELIVSGGVLPSYLKPGLYPIRKDLYMLMANHEYEYSGMNNRELTQATLHARKELNEIVNALRSLNGPWGNMQLIATAEQIGVREGRRVHGLYTLNKDDLIKGARFEDAVCRVTMGVDVHSTTKKNEDTSTKKGTSYNQGVKGKAYDVPLRSLIAKDVGGLMMAGRCISGDFIAHSSYRVTGNAVAMGEAVGRV